MLDDIYGQLAKLKPAKAEERGLLVCLGLTGGLPSRVVMCGWKCATLKKSGFELIAQDSNRNGGSHLVSAKQI